MNPKLWIMNTPAYKFGICFAQTYIMLPVTLVFKMARFFWTSGKNQGQCTELATFDILPPGIKITKLCFTNFFSSHFEVELQSHSKPLWDLEPREKAESSPMLHFILHLLVIFIAPALQPSQGWDVCKQPQCLGSSQWALTVSLGKKSLKN